MSEKEFSPSSPGGQSSNALLPHSTDDEQEMKRNSTAKLVQEERKLSYLACELTCNRAEYLCFDDKVKKIDYVLVYKIEDEQDKDEQEKKEKRECYQDNLKKLGVELEIEPKEKSQDGKTCFVKLHVPWHILVKYAEAMKIKMPLKVEKDELEEVEQHQDDNLCCCDCSWIGRFKQKFLHPFQLHNDLINENFGDQDYYTAEFTQDKMHFFDIKDKKTFFSNAERSRIAYRIMNETQWGKSRKNVGINGLLLDGVYVAAYPLHDGSVDPHAHETSNMRQLLYREWARWGKWYKFQPLDAIRSYLSDKIGLYFAFLEFYTLFLVIPSFVGLFVFIYGLATVFTTPFSTEICDESDSNYVGNLAMCPLCENNCSYWKLNASCLATRISYVFDNEATIFFAIFMSLWATFFLEFWKRRQFQLAYQWDLVDFDEERDLVRPEYEAQVDRERFNPATGKTETIMAPRDKFQRVTFSVINVMFWVGLIVVAVFSVIVYRVVMHAVFAVSLNPDSFGVASEFVSPSLLTTITGSLISLLIILLLNKVYARVAIWLTNLEIPRTRIDFEDSFTFKIFCFQFVNYYAFLFYVAFFKNTFTGFPGHYKYVFDRYRWEGCEAGGCMYELTVQLLIIMLGKQTINNIKELLVPWALNKYRIWKSKKAAKQDSDNLYTRWEKDFDLAPIEQDLFYEYLELIIQFGFITLFVAAFPLAPLFAFLNNIFEIRLDAIKFISQFRRPLALKASDIGAWYFLLEFIGMLAVVTNAFTIAITSEAIPKLTYYYLYSTNFYPERTFVGYVNNSLSVFDVSDFNQTAPTQKQPNVTTCWYKDYRTPPTADPKYQLSLQYWHVLAARLAFVIVMEHVVFFLKSFFDFVIPDRPKKLTAQIKREYYLVQNMLLQAEKEKIMSENEKALAELRRLYERRFGETPSSSSDPHEVNTNASNGSGIVTYANERKTTSM